jgi:hypothetical protein
MIRGQAAAPETDRRPESLAHAALERALFGKDTASVPDLLLPTSPADFSTSEFVRHLKLRTTTDNNVWDVWGQLLSDSDGGSGRSVPIGRNVKFSLVDTNVVNIGILPPTQNPSLIRLGLLRSLLDFIRPSPPSRTESPPSERFLGSVILRLPLTIDAVCETTDLPPL